MYTAAGREGKKGGDYGKKQPFSWIHAKHPVKNLGAHLWRRCTAGFPQQHFNSVHPSGHEEIRKLLKY
jgi:hypothetical protein